VRLSVRDGGDQRLQQRLRQNRRPVAEGRRCGITRRCSVVRKVLDAPDTAFFRGQAWSRVDEVTPGAFTALEDDEPRFRVDVTVPQGALSDR
jgi:hypothetical protein